LRRFGEPYLREKPYKVRPGAYAILVRDGHILLTHQSHPKPEYQLPGGGIDKGEQVLPALHREIFEETGWAASGLRRVAIYKRFTHMPEYKIWAEKRCSIYIGRPTINRKTELEEHHRAVFVPIDIGLRIISNSADQMFAASILSK